MSSLHVGYDAEGRPLRLSLDDRKTHAHIIGSSGSGKSKFMEWLMRGDITNRQGFALLDPHGTLYDAVAEYCAHTIPRQDVILLNVSKPDSIIGFNPFRKAPSGDVSVQVDRRIAATLHAWNVAHSDQTPTLERTLRLIFTVMLEHNLGLPQVQHLIDFNAHDIREHLIERLQTPLVQKEWRELQQLKPKEWRDETLSAKNRLFRFLTSTSLSRFMGLPERSIDLQAIMDEGKVLLVNLAPSDELSHENARVFGALLINEFFECALRRTKDSRGRDPHPYFLYADEFQNFVSLDIAEMLDQVRKFGLFLYLAHQRFGHLDENLTDAVLTNCKIKAVFGGLPVASARMMAEELFIGELDSKKIKAAIYQTKFWPRYSRDKVYAKSSGHSTSEGYSSGHSDSRSSGTFSGGGTSEGSGQVFMPPADGFFLGAGWFDNKPISTSEGTGTSSSFGESSTRGESDSRSESYGDSYSEGESEADIPIFVPVPFQELSSVQYYSPEEQLIELTAALKEQYGRHCFIKIQNQKTQPLLVPFVKSYYTQKRNKEWYIARELTKQQAVKREEIDELLKNQETALMKAVHPPSDDDDQEPQPAPAKRGKKPRPNIFASIDPSADD